MPFTDGHSILPKFTGQPNPMPPYENGFKVVSELNNSFDIGPDFVEPELEVDFHDLVDVEKYS